MIRSEPGPLYVYGGCKESNTTIQLTPLFSNIVKQLQVKTTHGTSWQPQPKEFLNENAVLGLLLGVNVSW